MTVASNGVWAESAGWGCERKSRPCQLEAKRAAVELLHPGPVLGEEHDVVERLRFDVAHAVRVTHLVNARNELDHVALGVPEANGPPDARLDCTAIVREFGVSLRPWREGLGETIDRLLANKDVP